MKAKKGRITDRERMDWLLENPDWWIDQGVYPEDGWWVDDAKTSRKAIDAAIRSERKAKGGKGG